MKILHIDSSINGDDSITRQLSAYALERFTATHEGADVERLDLVADAIPHLEGGYPGENDFQRQLQGSDLIIIGAPTYNFTVPTQLKAWFDRVAVAGQTFKYGENGPEGLLKDKRVIIAIASGGDYDDGHAFEHNKSYVTAFFNFLGLQPEIVAARGLAMGPDAAAKAISEAKTAIDQLAAA